MPTLDELQAQIGELQNKIAGLQSEANEIREKEKAGIIGDMKMNIAKYGITATELGFKANAVAIGKTPPSKVTGAPKYRDSETGQTWTGRGRAPQWLEGKNKEDYLVKS